MRRTSGPDHVVNLFGLGKHGYTNGEPGVSAATVEDAACRNAIQEEISRTIEGAGFALNPADNTQLYQSIVQIAQDASVTTPIDTSLIAGYAIERSAASNLHRKSAPTNFVSRAFCAARFGSEDGMFIGGSVSNVAYATAGVGDFAVATLMPGAASGSSLGGAAFNGTNLVFVGGSSTRSLIYSTATGTTYTMRLDVASLGPLYSVCLHQGQFVAVGAVGQVYRSASGTSWTPSISSPGMYLLGVASDGSRIVAVGHNGGTPLQPIVFTSDNGGTSWTARPIEAGPSTQALTSVVWTGSYWVAVGYAGEIMYSIDGAFWLRSTAAGGYTGLFRAVGMLGNYAVVAVGDAGEVQTSAPAGAVWTRVTKIAKNSGGLDVFTGAVNLYGFGSSQELRRGFFGGQSPTSVSDIYHTASW